MSYNCPNCRNTRLQTCGSCKGTGETGLLLKKKCYGCNGSGKRGCYNCTRCQVCGEYSKKTTEKERVGYERKSGAKRGDTITIHQDMKITDTYYPCGHKVSEVSEELISSWTPASSYEPN